MYEYLYLDDEGLSSLFAQRDRLTPDHVTTEIQRSRQTKGTAGAGGRLGRLLSSLGLPELELRGELSQGTDRTQGSKTDYSFRSENKLVALIEYLTHHGKIITDPYIASSKANYSGGTVFSNFRGRFLPQKRAKSDEWLQIANETGYLILHLASDERVRMGMSLLKIIEIKNGRISPNGHLSTRLTQDRGILLSVFGNIDSSKYIKPFAVSYISDSTI